MTREEYLSKRENLMNQAEKMVNEGNIEGFEVKKSEVEALDEQYKAEKNNRFVNMTFKNRAEYEAMRSVLTDLEEIEALDNAFETYARNKTNEEALKDRMMGLDLASRSVDLGNDYIEGEKIFFNGMNTNYSEGEKEMNSVFLNKGELLQNRYTGKLSESEQVLNQQGALGDVVRGMVTGKWSSMELKNVVTTTATGTLIPEVLSSKIIDMARKVSLFTQAGVPVVPMETNNMKISRVKTDPSFAFKAEGEAAAESSFELDDVTLNAKTCYGYAYVTLEAIKSSQNLDAILYKVFAEAMAQAIDNGMLYGQYNSTTSKYETFAPSGIMNDSAINSLTATAGAGYDDIIKAIGKVRGANGVPSVFGMNSNTEELFSLLKTTDGQYLAAPKAVADMQSIVSNQLSHNDSTGDDALVFDPQSMIIGMQNNIQIKIIEDGECLKKGLVGFQIYSMVDCQATQPKHICKVTGIKAASN